MDAMIVIVSCLRPKQSPPTLSAQGPLSISRLKMAHFVHYATRYRGPVTPKVVSPLPVHSRRRAILSRQLTEEDECIDPETKALREKERRQANNARERTMEQVYWNTGTLPWYYWYQNRTMAAEERESPVLCLQPCVRPDIFTTDKPLVQL
ncbi:hypothetical protein E2C01_029581 [Portunus trituberculatus]|uniref:Uncharacterized protein n=1 Tax=Portunus trituberculatus TaxID=210409 RepID=A0A5B7ETB2_PORTR|nr:hypothetical protein [Portunus trituberculatus]